MGFYVGLTSFLVRIWCGINRRFGAELTSFLQADGEGLGFYVVDVGKSGRPASLMKPLGSLEWPFLVGNLLTSAPSFICREILEKGKIN